MTTTSSLRTRLLLAVGVVALAAIATVAVATRLGTRRAFLQLQEVERHAVDAHTARAQQAMSTLLNGRCCDLSLMTTAEQVLSADEAVIVLDPKVPAPIFIGGEAVRGARDLEARLENGVLSIEMTRGSTTSESVALRFRKDPALIQLADGRAARLFVVQLPRLDGANQAAVVLGSLDRRLLVVIVIVAGLALAGTWIVAQNTTRPIRRLRDATALLARGALHEPVPTDGPHEIAELAGSFNRMVEDLGRQQTLRRNLMHDVTHELRAPLTALRCRLESVLDGVAADPAQSIRDLHEQVLHLSQLVDDLQEIALAEAHELRMQRTHAALADVVRSALTGTGLETDTRIMVDVTPGVAAHADPARLRQVVINLLTNADRHAPAGASILVRGRRDDGMAVIEVENGGSRLDEEQCERIFDRFYRTDPSRQRNSGGTGLGLAIVKHLVEAQGGRVWARSEGDRVIVGVALPASATVRER